MQLSSAAKFHKLHRTDLISRAYMDCEDSWAPDYCT